MIIILSKKSQQINLKNNSFNQEKTLENTWPSQFHQNKKLRELIKMEKKKKMAYILHFIDSARFMASYLSKLVTNFFEEVHKIKCKHGNNDKKCETLKLNVSIATAFLNT